MHAGVGKIRKVYFIVHTMLWFKYGGGGPTYYLPQNTFLWTLLFSSRTCQLHSLFTTRWFWKTPDFVNQMNLNFREITVNGNTAENVLRCMEDGNEKESERGTSYEVTIRKD